MMVCHPSEPGSVLVEIYVSQLYYEGDLPTLL